MAEHLYKNTGKTSESLRQNRVDKLVQLRNEKKEVVMAKRRILKTDGCDLNYDSTSLQEILKRALNSDLDIKLDAVKRIRTLVSTDLNQPIDDLISAGVLPILIQTLQVESSELKKEAVFALTNISGGSPDQISAAVNAGVVRLFISLLDIKNAEVCEQALFGLGNIISEGSDFRDHCIKVGIMEPLHKLITPTTPLKILQNVAFVLENLCRAKWPPLPKLIVEMLLPALSFLIQHKDGSIIVDTTWAICYLAKRNIEHSKLIIDSRVIQSCVIFLSHPEEKVHNNVLRALGNAIVGDELVKAILDASALPSLLNLLLNATQKTKKEALWFISNIAAGSKDDIQAIFDAMLFPVIVQLLSVGDFSLQEETAWIISNIAVGGNEKQIWSMVEAGVVAPLCNLLAVPAPEIVHIILGALKEILIKSAPRSGDVIKEIEESNGLEKIECLLNNKNHDIFQMALWLYDTYFHQGDNEFQEVIAKNKSEFRLGEEKNFQDGISFLSTEDI